MDFKHLSVDAVCLLRSHTLPALPESSPKWPPGSWDQLRLEGSAGSPKRGPGFIADAEYRAAGGRGTSMGALVPGGGSGLKRERQGVVSPVPEFP